MLCPVDISIAVHQSEKVTRSNNQNPGENLSFFSFDNANFPTLEFRKISTHKSLPCVYYVRTSINTVAIQFQYNSWQISFLPESIRVFKVYFMRLKTVKTMVEKMKFVKLSASGMEMPIVGLGTWRAQPQEMENAVNIALEAGYRHIGEYF